MHTQLFLETRKQNQFVLMVQLESEFLENKYLERNIVCNIFETEILLYKHIAFNA